jgi:hypothetical protein
MSDMQKAWTGFFPLVKDCKRIHATQSTSTSGIDRAGATIMTVRRLSGRLPSHREFAKPLTVTIKKDVNGYYTVTDEHHINYGYAPTRGEAIAEYKRMLVADYLWLQEVQPNLSEPLQQEWEWTKQFIAWR